MKHKWAKEIIHWANGGEIEIRTPLSKFTSQQSWCKFQGNTFPMVEFEDGVALDVEYRIKPQPKPDIYLYVYQMGYDYKFSSEKESEMKFSAGFAMCTYHYAGKIKLIGDDE